jgi:hypothetical protein
MDIHSDMQFRVDCLTSIHLLVTNRTIGHKKNFLYRQLYEFDDGFISFQGNNENGFEWIAVEAI